MAGTGARKGERRGGRKKGVPNKASVRRQMVVSATGATPLDVMLKDMRYHLALAEDALAQETPDKDLVTKELSAARDAAKDAAPYVHPKLATLQTKTELTGRLTLEQLVGQSIKYAEDI